MQTISKSECKCIISSFILIFPFIFAEFLPGAILLLCGTLLVSSFFGCLKAHKTTLEILSLLACVFIPISFVSVSGGNYGVFPISWFNIVLILLALSLFRDNLSKKDAFFTFAFCVFLLIEIFLSMSIIDAIKQTLNLILFILAIPIGKMLKRRGIANYSLIKFYIWGVFIYAIMILFQYLYIRQSGNIIGRFNEYGGNRSSYCALFSDYSFASLYLCSGIAFIVVRLLQERGHLFFQVFEIVIMFSAMLLTGARTGLVALAAALLLYIMLKIFHKKSFYYLILTFTSIILPFALIVMMRRRPEESLFSLSGRMRTYTAGLQAFVNSPIFGAGLGIRNFSNQFAVEIPHNFFIQYLAQIGFLGLSFLIVYLLNALLNTCIDNNSLLPFLLVLIGSMAIPDICNSRYLIVIIMILCSGNLKVRG